MQNTFLISDTHFGHLGMCQFLRDDGTKLRPWSTPEEMDEELVKRWNEVVRPADKVYHLGDVVINRKYLPILDRLNGDKILIKGNHDIFKLKDYTAHFRDIRAYHVVDKLIFSHIPIHPDSKSRFVGNVHGHLHARSVMKRAEQYSAVFQDKNTTSVHFEQVVDPFYFCVSVENIDYRPINYDEIKSYFNIK